MPECGVESGAVHFHVRDTTRDNLSLSHLSIWSHSIRSSQSIYKTHYVSEYLTLAFIIFNPIIRRCADNSYSDAMAIVFVEGLRNAKSLAAATWTGRTPLTQNLRVCEFVSDKWKFIIHTSYFDMNVMPCIRHPSLISKFNLN